MYMYKCKRVKTIVMFIVLAVISVFGGLFVSLNAQAAVQVKTLDLYPLDSNGTDITTCGLTNTNPNEGGNKLHYYIYYDPDHRPSDGYHTMLYIHGGGWTGIGARWGQDNNYDAINYFTTQGFVIIDASYRLLGDKCGNPLTNITTDDQQLDIGMAFVRAFYLRNFMDYWYHTTPNNYFALDMNINEKILMVGESAGGHLASSFAVNIPADMKPYLGGVVAVGAPLDFLDLLDNYAYYENNYYRSMNLGGYSISVSTITPDILLKQCMNPYYLNSPGHQANDFSRASRNEGVVQNNTLRQKVTSNTVPFLLIVGDNDPVVPPEQSKLFCQAFGTPAFLIEYNTHKVFSCGTGNSRMLVVPNGGHVPTMTSSPSKIDGGLGDLIFIWWFFIR